MVKMVAKMVMIMGMMTVILIQVMMMMMTTTMMIMMSYDDGFFHIVARHIFSLSIWSNPDTRQQ